MRRIVVAGAVSILLGIGGVVHHSRAQSTTLAARDDAEAAQRTTVAGTVPSLEGRWLSITSVGTAGGAVGSSASLWDVTRGAEGLVLRERHVVLPEPQRGLAGRPDWTPSTADLESIADAWATLPTESRGIARVEHELLGRDALPAEVAAEPLTAAARWIVRQTYLFEPGGSRPIKQVRLLAAHAEDPAGFRGSHLTVVLAAAPLPLPIQIRGTFRLFRLSPPTRSVWARIAGAFRGCN
jgi:hypothetical protein